MPSITSTHNSHIKLVRALLGRTKERRENNAFVAEGVRLVEEAQAAGWGFRFVLYSENLSGRGKILISSLQAGGVVVEETRASVLDALSNTGNTQGILAVLDLPESTPPPRKPDFVLIPDQIRDPGNLGTLLRSAAAAGVQAVLLPPETTDAYAPKVVRAGMGAHFKLPIHTLPWDEIRSWCAGLNVLLADMGGTPCWESELCDPLALIVGGEAEGASPAARELADQVTSIPMSGGIESLNAGVAGAILMFEVVRQRTTGKLGGSEAR